MAKPKSFRILTTKGIAAVHTADPFLTYWADGPAPRWLWAIDGFQRMHAVERTTRGEARHACWTLRSQSEDTRASITTGRVAPRFRGQHDWLTIQLAQPSWLCEVDGPWQPIPTDTSTALDCVWFEGRVAA